MRAHCPSVKTEVRDTLQASRRASREFRRHALVEVASASFVESVAAGLNPYDLPLKQGMWTVAGVLIMFGLARLPARVIRALAWPMMAAAIVALGLVFTPLGMTVNGNRNWLSFG